MATLELRGVRKSFGEVAVLHGIDMTLADGEMLVIVGASGCGKSTLLRLVAGLETITSGSILVGGRDVTHADPSKRDMAMVFQNYALYPHMTVFDNMAYGLRIQNVAKGEIKRRVDEAAALLGLDQLLARRPRQLSGGQRQRVAMGRAIVRNPKLFLFDEPLSNLDAKLRVQMRAEIHHLQRRLGVTSLYVTHDQTEAMTLGDRLLVLNKGIPAQFATPLEIYNRPADTYVATFIGLMNLLPGRLAGAGVALDNGMQLPLPAPLGADGTRVSVGIRPEDVMVADTGLPVKADLVERLGAETLLHGSAAGGTKLIARLPAAATPGETITLGFAADRLHLFDAGTGKRLS
jgi:sn-glycerol 3-phosphate transport system ATP-binding protein